MLFCVPNVQFCLLMMDILYLSQTAELHIALCSSVNLFPYRLFIGAIFHMAFNGNHQWCCNPNPFRSLFHSPRQFDGAIVIMSLCVCVCKSVCVSVLLSIIAPLQVQCFSHSPRSVVRLFMHVCFCMCVFVCTVLFAQLQTQHSSLLIHRAVSPDKCTQSC